MAWRRLCHAIYSVVVENVVGAVFAVPAVGFDPLQSWLEHVHIVKGQFTYPSCLFGILLLLHLLSKQFRPNHGPLRELLHHSDLPNHGQC